MNSPSHAFNIQFAVEYGIEEAIMIQHFQHWIAINKRLKRNQHEGRTWSYQSLVEISAHFPYWTKDKVKEIIIRLTTGKSRRSNVYEFEPVLITGNFNKSKFDKTTWYAFADENKFMLWSNAKIEENSKNVSDVGDCLHPLERLPTPIPDTKPDTKNNNNNNDLRDDKVPKSDENGAAAPNPAAAVVFLETLKKIDIPHQEKLWLEKNYTAEEIEHAVKFATHPETQINTTLEQTIKWACKAKPELPKKSEDLIQENKCFAEKFRGSKNNYYVYDILNKGIEIYSPNAQCEVYFLGYDNASFKDLLKIELNKKGFIN